jgi:predicted acylesterase/phospholipase RssA
MSNEEAGHRPAFLRVESGNEQKHSKNCFPRARQWRCIASIAGCSMGALIGGIYAAGKLGDFETWVKEVTKVDIVNLLDLAWQSDGLVKGDKIINTLVDLVGDVQIEDLPMPYTAVAADIVSGTEVWLTSGRLFDAIRASISLPLFFTPVPHRAGQLIDGGVLNPVPIALTSSARSRSGRCATGMPTTSPTRLSMRCKALSRGKSSPLIRQTMRSKSHAMPVARWNFTAPMK